LASATAFATRSETSRSASPWISSTGAVTWAIFARNVRDRASIRTSERAASRNSPGPAGCPYFSSVSAMPSASTSGGMRFGSTQHSASVSRTCCSGVRRRRRRLSAASPTPGSDIAAKVTATRGSMGARAGRGSAGSTSTRPVTRSGAAAASSSEIAPPIELPMSTAGSPAISRRKRSSSRRLADTVVLRPAAGVRPCPARSTASTRARSVSAGATAAQFHAAPPRPCTHTMSGPSEGPPKSK